MAAVVVAAAALISPSPAAAAKPPRSITWFAGGDSYSAGFGLSSGVPGGSACQVDEQNAWPYKSMERVKPDVPIATFTLNPCTGAISSDLTDRQWDKTTRYDLVSFNFGGNDTGFAKVLGLCVGISTAGALIPGFKWLTDEVGGCPPDSLGRDAIEAVVRYYKQFLLNTAAEMLNPGGNVLVVGYPALLEDPKLWNFTAKKVGLCNGINPDGANRVRGWAGLLNQRIGQAVEAANAARPNGVRFTFVNVQDGKGNPSLFGTDPTRSPSLFEAAGSSDRHNLCGSPPG